MDDAQGRGDVDEEDGNANTTTSSSTATATLPTGDLLSQLLAALTSGARAVQGLPLGDDYEYQTSFPEFRQLIGDCQEGLVDNIRMAIQEYYCNDQNGVLLEQYNLEDPLLWEACADACDALLEQVEAHFQNDDNDYTKNASLGLSQLSDTARQRAQSSFGRLLEGIVDIEKPQIVHQFYNNNNNNNGGAARCDPFVPPIAEKPHAMTPLDLSLQPGHGLESRFGELRPSISVSPTIVAPSHHVPHVYETEIKTFPYTEWQLEPPQKQKPQQMEQGSYLPYTWIDTTQGLQQVVSDILDTNVQEIALDLEAHSYRSFAGFTCLIQLSYYDNTKKDCHQDGADATGQHVKPRCNYIIDPFPLWHQLNPILAPIFANPEIVKVLHGADSDIQWLQRDFGLYIVNLFDTGRAARALGFPSAGYAYLVKHYLGFTPDKTHQLSDWRQRPLPPAMIHYAVMDSHYLLDIYNYLRYDLAAHAETSITDVLDISRKVSLIRYCPEPFRPDGYKSLIHNYGKRKQFQKGSSRKVMSELNDKQELVLRRLYDWRDQTARESDESLQYVCSNQGLVRLALSCPKNLTTLQGLLNPLPPLVLRHAKEILNLIQTAAVLNNNDGATSMDTASSYHRKTPVVKTSHGSPPPPVGAPSSAFFKPAKTGDEQADEYQKGVRLLSPVLGTEALYSQAGWITPQQGEQQRHDSHSDMMQDGMSDQIDAVVTTTDDDDLEDEEDDDGDEDNNTKKVGGSNNNNNNNNKPRKTLTVNEANRKYRSNQSTSHSLQLGGSSNNNLEHSNADNSTSDQHHHHHQSNKNKNKNKNHSNLGQAPKTVDGMGSARAARENTATTSIHEDVEGAKRAAADVRSSLSQDEEFMGLISSAGIDEIDEEDESNAVYREDNNNTDQSGESRGGGKTKEQTEEEFIIPRSMREIYRISNRNRRNKKASSPAPAERSRTPSNEKEAEALAKAEEVLRSRGLEGQNYFGEMGGSPKRQRTKSAGALSDDGQQPQAGQDSSTCTSRDDDIKLMKEIGWITGKEEVESLLNQRGEREGDGDDGVAARDAAADDDSDEEEPSRRGGGGQKFGKPQATTTTTSKPNFNYSTVGAIGAFDPTAPKPDNPFFAGAAVAGGHLNQHFGKTEKKRNSNNNNNNNNNSNTGGGRGRQSRRQIERPEKKDGRSQAYRKR